MEALLWSTNRATSNSAVLGSTLLSIPLFSAAASLATPLVSLMAEVPILSTVNVTVCKAGQCE